MAVKAAQVEDGKVPMVSKYSFKLTAFLDSMVKMQPRPVGGTSITHKILISHESAEAQLLRFFLVGALGFRRTAEVDLEVEWKEGISGAGYNF